MKKIHKAIEARYDGDSSWIKIEISAPASVIADIQNKIYEILNDAEPQDEKERYENDDKNIR